MWQSSGTQQMNIWKSKQHGVDKVTRGNFLTRNEKQFLLREARSRVANMSSLLWGQVISVTLSNPAVSCCYWSDAALQFLNLMLHLLMEIKKLTFSSLREMLRCWPREVLWVTARLAKSVSPFWKEIALCSAADDALNFVLNWLSLKPDQIPHPLVNIHLAGQVHQRHHW